MPEDPRLIAQVQLVLNNLKGSAASPLSWREDGLDFLYREHSLLVRLADVPRVVPALRSYLRAVLRNGARDWPGDGGYDPERSDRPGARRDDDGEPIIRQRPVIADVIRLDYENDAWDSDDPLSPSDDRRASEARVPAVIDALTEHAVGRGTIRPESVLYVAPHPCPATEPEEVPRGTHRPYPEISTRAGCGCGPEHCTGAGITVTVADLGVDQASVARHDWLTGVDGEAEDPYQPGGTTMIRPYAGHGTFVAGCVRVTAPDAEVYVEKFVEITQPPDPTIPNAGAVFEALAVEKLAETLSRSPDVVMFEFTTSTMDDLPLMAFDALYESRIKHLPGMAIVTPAGNEGERRVNWPGAYEWAISVGALSSNGRSRADFSNYGFWVDVYAPGEGLVNAFPKGKYRCTEPPNAGEKRRFPDGMARWSGTSFSAPLVAGLIAARVSCTGESPRQAADTLLGIAREQHLPGVGPVLYPGRTCCGAADEKRCVSSERRCPPTK
ncbi:S8 family peptidase [Cryptosporangium minutisporangium]|uniref:Peptidase S8/S53 domain-containing protein n=1 Tax=Cryptosporangium minutisporangium TaxID=113569 RepID=A0ABP6SYY9_9ACTN